MADICTMVSAITQTIACLPAMVCNDPPIDGRVFCHPDLSAVYRPCGKTIVDWSCKREDGTIYKFTETKD